MSFTHLSCSTATSALKSGVVGGAASTAGCRQSCIASSWANRTENAIMSPCSGTSLADTLPSAAKKVLGWKVFGQDLSLRS